MLKKLLILLLSLAAFPALCMDAAIKLTHNQAIDDELVTVELQDKQLFKVSAQHAKLSKTLSNLIDDVGTDDVLPIPNVSPAMWGNILRLMPHLISATAEATNRQEKEKSRTIIFNVIKTYHGATLVEFIKAVNFLDIPLLLELAIKVIQKTDIEKITLEQIISLPKEIRNHIISQQVIQTLGFMPYTLRAAWKDHECSVTSLCISPDGNTIASGSQDGTVRIWNNDGTLRAVCNGHDIDVRSVCISPDGNTIVSGSEDGTVRIWNNDGTCRAVCNGHDGFVRSVCISPDGNTIASGSDDRTVRIWFADGTLRAICKGHGEVVGSVCISADGNTIISGCDDGILRIWNIDGTLRAEANDHENWIGSVGISNDGNTIISGSFDESMCIWDSDGSLRKRCDHGGIVRSVCISSEGKTIVTGCDDHVLRIWNTDGALLAAIKGHYDSIVSVCISKDGNTIVSGSSDNTVRIWNRKGALCAEFDNHTSSIESVCISADGNRIISGFTDGTLCIWDKEMFASLLKNMNTEQAQGIWIFLQKLIPMLKTGLVQINAKNCWISIHKLIKTFETKNAQEKVDGGQPLEKRRKPNQ